MIITNSIYYYFCLNQAMASQLAASNNNSGLNLSTAATNGSANNQPSDLSNNQPLNEIQLAAHQRFMMMMFLYQQFLQAQTQSTWVESDAS